MKTLITLIIFTCLFNIRVNAQQDPMISQYMFNGLFLNPAYAGSHKYISSSLLYRSQWLNFPGAPQTSLLAVDGLVPSKANNMGLGLIVAHDQIGATEQTDIFANYAYQLRLGKGKLAFGMKAGASNYIFKSDGVTVWDANDAVFTGRRTAWLPKVGAGLYYFTDRWYAGLSVPTLVAYDAHHDFTFDVNKGTFVNRHYYLTGGYVFTLSPTVKLKPSMLLKYLPSAPVEADINLNLLYREKFWVGASYRSQDAVVIMLEYQSNARFRIGYAFDYSTSKIRKYSAGTHEIMIGYDFGKDLMKIKTPRYF